MQPKCNLIVDSCCDLPISAVDKSGVSLIKFPYFMDGVEHIDDLYQTTSPRDFFSAMSDKKRQPPMTSQLPARVLHDEFEKAYASGVPTVYLSFSSGLSGSYDSAVLMRDTLAEQYPDGKLYIVDTKLASIAEGLLVLGAIEQRKAGLSAEEMVAWVEEARYFVNAQFMVDDLEALRRGGRIPSGVALAGAKLDVKPLLGFDLDGNLTLVGMARGRKKGIRQLAEYYSKHFDAADRSNQVLMGNADCPKDMERLRSEVGKVNPTAVFVDSSIGPVIGSHVGSGMLAVVFWGPDRREDLSVADRIARKVKGK